MLSILALLIFIYWISKSSPTIAGIGIVVAVVGLILGGSALQANLKTSLYPFEPQSWSTERWIQSNSSCIPRANVFEDTHTPARLRIAGTCVEAVGVVRIPPFIAGDGDYCFDIIPENKELLAVGNYVLRKGGLHVEVVPADQEKVLGEIGGVCPGDVVRVRGVWVVDTDHGMWAEIHPAEKIEIVKGSKERWPECVMGKRLE